MINLLARVSPALAGRAAFKLFCTPRKQFMREEDSTFLETAERQTLVLEGIPIALYSWPAPGAQNAPAVMFLHGWESHSGRWRKFIPPLREAGFHVMAFDAPAHGHSGGKEINLPLFSRVLKALMLVKGVPYALVGHSLGGAAVIMSMGAFDAPRVKKAVVMGSFAESTRVLTDFASLLGLEPIVVQQVGQEIMRRSGIPIEAYSVEGKAAALDDIQGLVLHDRDDDVAPIAEGRAIAKAWNARFVETHGLGHRMQGKQVVQMVRDFLLE